MINFDKKQIEKLDIQEVYDLSEYSFVKDSINLIPYQFAKNNMLLPIEERKDGSLLVATSDPLNHSSIKELNLILKKKINVVYATKEILTKAIESCYKQKENTKTFFSSFESKEKEEENIADLVEGYDLLEQDSTNSVIKILNAIIIEALQQKASDIHFEPMDNELLLRYRIDGVLQKRFSPPSEFLHQIITRIKVMSKLDIAEKRRPQDGRIKLRLAGREIDFRVSTVPVINGERVVLRILDKENIVMGLRNLGMPMHIYKDFKNLISLPEGIILVTGPTGSGKTTTLYSAIEEINTPKINIMTVEDPVEYKLSNIAQIAVNPKIGITFASGLRHILRQDPDVIMIGEIRDLETAEIAIQASLTGHLVFSTLHTNDAPSAIARMADMGIEPYLLSSSIVGVLAQRLVRKICPHCKVSYSPELDELKKLGMKRKDVAKLYRGEGCSFCFNSGYKDRIGIYELMPVTSPIKKQIMSSVDTNQVRSVAMEQNMKNLIDNGADLVRKGLTTPEEVFRVAKIIDI